MLQSIHEKTVRPVGQATEVPVDVRILSATHKNLGDLVAEGSFREDLYYRINVIELEVPPLRDRGQDIAILAEDILAKLAAEMGVAPLRLKREAQKALLEYHFPGNVRELENILERALTLATGDAIGVEDIQLRPQTSADEDKPAGPVSAECRNTAA